MKMNSEKPNILLILTDQQRFDSLSCTGSTVIDTPNLDRLATDGTLFENCICSCPVCTPSRASLWTGKDLPAHGVHRLYDNLPGTETLFPELLRKRGYRTGLFGKLHVSSLHHEAVARHPNDGFDVYEWCNEACLYLDSPWNGYGRRLRERAPVFCEKLARERRAVKHIPKELHFTRWAVDETCSFIQSTSVEQPWFACLSIFDPHNPYDCGPRDYYDAIEESRIPSPIPAAMDMLHVHKREASEGYLGDISSFTVEELAAMRRGYYSTLKFLDDEAGRLFRFLDDRNLFDRTLIIFSSDHGDMLGDHGLLVKGNFFFDPSVRVPLLLRQPGRFEGGKRIPSPVRNFDVAPTILAAAGYSPEELAERMPDARILTDSGAGRSHVLCRYRNTGIRAAGGYWNAPEMNGTMIRDTRWKLSFYPETGEGELYDLQTDPQERHNLWETPRSQPEKKRLTALLNREISPEEFRHAPPGGETLPPGGFQLDNRLHSTGRALDFGIIR